MGTKTDQLRIFFIPLMSPGHMIPMIDIAKLLSRRRGVSVTVVTTPGNEPFIRPSIDDHHAIELILLPFPSSAAHFLPNGKENLTSIPSSDFPSFFAAFFALQPSLHDLLRLHRPDCIVSDFLFHATSDIALELGIPRLVFHGPGIFPLCVHDSLYSHGTHKKSEVFVIEDVPHRIEMTRSELSGIFATPMLDALVEAERRSFGVIVNSFYELEPAYAELYKKQQPGGRRAYYVGPVSLVRGQKLGEEAELMRWLNSKPAGSAVYVCFGSLAEFSADQLKEIALGLEASGHPFVWVVRNWGKLESELVSWFEERVEGKGVIVRGWAPQVVILNHEAVGGFVTHCGWNSTLEGVSAGVPMVAWPIEYEQFVNERFITEVLGIGVRVRRRRGEEVVVVKREEIAKAVDEVMGGGEEAEGRRRRAREFAAMAKRAVGEGGSSFMDTSRLIAELEELKAACVASES